MSRANCDLDLLYLRWLPHSAAWFEVWCQWCESNEIIRKRLNTKSESGYQGATIVWICKSAGTLLACA